MNPREGSNAHVGRGPLPFGKSNFFCGETFFRRPIKPAG